MALTKSDLQAIREIVKEEVHNETEPSFTTIDKRFDSVDKRFDKLDKKFTDLFDYLDKDAYDLRKKIASHLDIDVSELTRSTN